MKKIGFFSILPLIATLFIFSHLSAATRGISIISKHGDILNLYKDYHALVIGITDYERCPRLPNAVNDAKEVSSKLKELGFQVKLILEPNYREMRTALTDMVYEMGSKKDRAVLFYYAGHGETEVLADGTKMGYIIPKDCPILSKDPRGFSTHAISMSDIESASLRIRSKHVLMLFDSCFSGSLFALVRAVPADITEKSTLPVRQYITAGREDEQVPDKSMFKRCFLIGLDGDADLTGGGYITGSELGMYLSDKVINYTHRRQHPQYGKINNPDLDRGDFIFAFKKPSQPSPSSLETERKHLAEERARIERKRQELDRLKVEIERQKLEEELNRLKAEKQKLEVAKLIPKQKYSPPVYQSKEINRVGTYIAYANGIVRDTKTGLEWVAGPDKGMSYNEAKSWVASLNIDGDGWRMPTADELKSLKKVGKGKHNMTSLLKTTGWWVWSTKDSSVLGGIHFCDNERDWTYAAFPINDRAFAVRSRNDR